jgi:hypothetical protein
VGLVEGDSVTIVHGPKGGWHIEVGGLVEHSETEIAIRPTITVPDLGDLQISGTQQPSYYALVGYDAAVCQGTFYNVRAFVDAESDVGADPQAFVCSLAGRSLVMSVVVEDIVSGRSAAGEVAVVAELDPADVPICN